VPQRGAHRRRVPGDALAVLVGQVRGLDQLRNAALGDEQSGALVGSRDVETRAFSIDVSLKAPDGGVEGGNDA
jgi:hypothetical protein